MIIVDTNVLAYLLIEGDQTASAQALFTKDPDWRSDRFVRIEFSNLVATYHRSKRLTPRAAASLLSEAERLVPTLVDLPHHRALTIAIQHGVSAHDARFLGAADSLGSKLVTEDVSLRRAAPALTQSLADAIA